MVEFLPHTPNAKESSKTSVMNIVLAFNVIGLIFGLPIFDLDSGVVDTVLSADFRGVPKDFLFVSIHEDMRTHRRLANAERPDVEIMDFNDMLNREELFSEVLDFDVLWCAFHEHSDAVFHDMHCREHDENREKVRANRIG